MYLHNGEKKALTIIAVVAVVFVVVVASTTFLLVRDEPREHPPYLHLAVGGELYKVEPRWYCDVLLRDCHPSPSEGGIPNARQTPRTPIPVGESTMLTVSSDIAEGPWKLNLLYSTPRGLTEVQRPLYKADSTYTIVLKSEPGRVLLGLTVLLPSAVELPDGSVPVRAELAADTRPEGFRLLDR
ncbi:DUF2771 family protein [Gordonia sp. ABSL1-1]|uniref:DUF2771 family protein n=1 Tax=Gordonia sp. ABSL1-1 TaxID=3053923 RepID=UPI0025738074|nr:DUF2771 family protein [Gordonia sp. ABSL1-1]MDL9937787.1 DUF2771 family protein [Gordonia sp. ABSL1-1]